MFHVFFKSAGWVHVNKVEQVLPILSREFPLFRRNRRLVRHRLVTRQDSLAKKSVRHGINGELEISIMETIPDTPGKCAWQLFCIEELDHASDSPAGNEAESQTRGQAPRCRR